MFPKIFVSEFCNQLWSADKVAELHFFEKAADLKLGTAVKKNCDCGITEIQCRRKNFCKKLLWKHSLGGASFKLRKCQ
jgi:hypothetical protein